MKFEDMSAAAVRAWLKTPAAQQAGLPEAPTVTRVHASAHSGTGHPAACIFKAVSPTLPHALAIKLTDTGSVPAAAEWFDREAGLLQKLNNGTSLAPALYVADKPSGILVTEWLEGRNLRTHLYRNMFSASHRARAITAAGRWLKQFHDACGVDDGKIDMTVMLDDLRALIHARSGERTKQHNAWLDILYRAQQTLSQTPGLTSLCHGDFSPNNLIVSDAQMTLRAFDFSNPQPMHIEQDMAQFLLNRTVKLPVPDAGTEPSAFWKICAPWHAFAEGYHGSPAHMPGNWLSWHIARFALLRCSSLAQSSRDKNRSFIDRADRQKELQRLEKLAGAFAHFVST